MEEERNYKVYAHIRKEPDENGVYKRYIGITCQKLKDRWKANGNGYKKKDKNGNYIYFYNAILKYGWGGFTHILLLQNLTREEALNWEVKLIKIYESNNEYYGYNGTEGGEHALHSEKTKQKISNSHKGKIVSEITKDKLRKINNGKKLAMETRIKMSKTRKGMYSEELNSILSTDGSKQRKRIFWYTNNQKNIDIIQEACVKNGHAFSVRSENKSGFKKSSHSYVCCITKNWDFVKNKNRVSEIPYDDYSYCITTENGTLITRIDGKVAITGNCHLRKYSEKNADLDSIISNEFKLNTIPQIESIPKKDLRQLCRKLSQMEFFYFGVNRYVVCHGGIPCEPSILTPTVELIKGVGKYEDDELIGKNFRKNSCKNCILVHAHRNIFNRPIKVSDNHYNLCDSPETGGCVRIIEIEKNGEIKEILQQNTVYNVKAERPVSTLDLLNVNTKNDTLKQMNESKLIQKKVLDNGIVSYNFTRKCFYDKIWNDLTCKARGLFVDSETDKVIARGYDKFFSI